MTGSRLTGHSIFKIREIVKDSDVDAQSHISLEDVNFINAQPGASHANSRGVVKDYAPIPKAYEINQEGDGSRMIVRVKIPRS